MTYIHLPQSKSMSARALILDFIAGGDGPVSGLPAVLSAELSDCDDTRELAAALRQLRRGGDSCFYLGSGGASMRFFTALVASLPGFEGVVDCSEQLRGRPVAPLVEALRSVGARVEYLERPGHPPLALKGPRHGEKLSAEGLVLECKMSSQFASALVMASLLWKERWCPDARQLASIPSRPYLEMTLRMTDAAVAGRPLPIEGDWSAAGFYYELLLLNPEVSVALEGLQPEGVSCQGDARTQGIFARLGIASRWTSGGGLELSANPDALPAESHQDMKDIPDLVPALAMGLGLKGVKFRLTGVGNLVYKESNRIEALCNELHRLGAVGVTANGEELRGDGRLVRLGPGSVDCRAYGDHRMAMALAVAAVNPNSPIRKIEGLECISKSYPSFLKILKNLTEHSKIR